MGKVEDNNIDVVRLVVDHGANLNYRGGHYHSAMRAAVFYGNIAAAHFLLDHNIEVDDDIFLEAIRNERRSVVPRLLEMGIDVNAENRHGTALQFAIKNGDAATIRFVLCSFLFVTTDLVRGTNFTAFAPATSALLGHPEIDVNALGNTDQGLTALGLAILHNNMEVVKQLLALGADPNQPSDKSLCLVRAIRRGDMELATLLLDAGADVNGSLPRRRSALMAACGSDNETLVEFLLNHGADVNLWVAEEGDALQAAAREGHEGIVRLLLDRGANPRAREGRYGSCLECAIAAKSMTLVNLLLGVGAAVNYSGTLADLRDFRGGFGSPLSASLWNRQDGLTRLLLESGADPNWPGTEYCGTALEEAIENDDEEAVRLLLEHGANVNQVAGQEGFALAYAIRKHTGGEGGDKYIHLLLERGADVNMSAGGQYETPLIVSCMSLPLSTPVFANPEYLGGGAYRQC